ncbi:hypothetical protein AB0D45_12525 [Streptomyces sp. NPDC048352]|uniref:hypothetical protein n=1 Tax=Streptomyces sp. NPDC048352 TaxID=3154718 RepID=UPI0034457213
MSAATADGPQTGRRVEEVLDRLAASGDPRARAAAEELVSVLMDFYGAGLARIVERLGALPPGADPLGALLEDELTTSLLTLHDLHPEDVHTRIARALDALPEAELDAFDESDGTLRLRSVPAGGCGCGGGAEDTLRRIEDVVAAYAPEVVSVELAPAAPQPPLLQIAARPPAPARTP